MPWLESDHAMTSKTFDEKPRFAFVRLTVSPARNCIAVRLNFAVKMISSRACRRLMRAMRWAALLLVVNGRMTSRQW